MAEFKTNNKKILILQMIEEHSKLLSSFLLKNNYSSQIVPYSEDLKINEVTKEKDIDYFFVVFCGNSEDQCFSNIKKILEIDKLNKFPLLVIGKDAHIYESILSKNFAISVTLTYPYQNDDILTGIKFLERLLERKKEREKNIPAPKSIEETPKDDDDITNMIFDYFITLGISDKNFNGQKYAKSFKEPKELGMNVFPKDKNIQLLINELNNIASPWAKKHFCRVSFIVSCILSQIAIPEKLIEAAKCASFLFAYILIKEKSNLLKNDFLGTQSIDYKETFSNKILEARNTISSKHNIKELNDIFSVMASIVRGEEIQGNDNIYIIASCILLADMIDKACWQEACWNPRAGYRIFNTFKKKEFIKYYNPIAVCCIIKYLSESILSTSYKFFLDGNTSSDEFLIQCARDTKNYNSKDYEERIDISSLATGMQLSKPLVSFDGREILGANVVLDNDLVWRIWQISAIKPLNSPTIVKKDKKKKVSQG